MAKSNKPKLCINIDFLVVIFNSTRAAHGLVRVCVEHHLPTTFVRMELPLNFTDFPVQVRSRLQRVHHDAVARREERARLVVQHLEHAPEPSSVRALTSAPPHSHYHFCRFHLVSRNKDEPKTGLRSTVQAA